ncbi:trichothecene C-8 hydroxylase [Truncatella angustata]|uniref:Trichothecene C-8 hydroxylase n=1 Tax=Truncatella angustata TaxID=152316 RepID=A0A9P8RES6_9PEZI|nr:trichothecene C-8 hydroxylase [Truncatella angustata]KAH6639959.1 trichothecene C-8 hydroxylase [Truncatella angustata]
MTMDRIELTVPFRLAGVEAPIPYFVAIVFVFLTYFTLQGNKVPALPLVNGKKFPEISNGRTKKHFALNASEVIQHGIEAQKGSPFRAIADVGEVVLLPPEFANEIRNDNRFSFVKHVRESFHGHLPGFVGFDEGSRDSMLLRSVSQKQLTHQLAKVTEPLSDETSTALQELLTDNLEWHTVALKSTILQLVARISSKVFLGDQLCRNQKWLDISVGYTTNVFAAAEELRLWPRPLRNIVHWFLPRCRVARKQVKEARNIVQPLVESRNRENAERLAAGKEPVLYNDAIQWCEDNAKGSDFDAPIMQLMMSVVAIHTTTDLLCQVMLDLAEHHSIVEPLRNEVRTILQEGGWKKTSLYNMKLLDSVVKESQRLKPITIASMRRVTTEEVRLSNGLVLPPGTKTAVLANRMWDPSVHENPLEWDGYRFFNMRQLPGKEQVSQLVSTSADHLGFGHGQHACPGRFFAANEVKIALCHLLIKYDWRLAQGAKPNVRRYGFSLSADPLIQVQLSRRKEDIEA